MSMLPESDDKADGQLKKTLLVDSIAPTLTLFFRKRKRSESTSDLERANSSDLSDESDLDGPAAQKRRKVQKSKEQEEFEKRDKQYEAELPEEYRRFRPVGHRFNLPPTDRPVRIYADGVFDLFHLGHMRQLEQAKKSFENVELVCGIPSDKETHKRKGLTVLSDQQRIDTLKHCRWVDEVIPNAPWCVTADFLLEHKIDYVAHDDLPYASADSDDIYKPIKERGMFLVTQRTEGISTSDIITKVIRDYDKYLMRNFARGATRKELNVSWLKKNELDFKKHVNDFRTYWMRNKTSINNVSKDLYFEVREYLRGKKSDLSFANFANNHLPHSNSSPNLVSDLDDALRALSPLTEFASKYIVNKNEKPGRFFKGFNINNWIQKDDSHDEDERPRRKRTAASAAKNELTTSVSAPATTLPRKIRKPRSRKQH